MYPDIIDIKTFTEKNFKLAFTVTVTRCFGWSLPSTMVIPFADCANHFIIDNQYEMYNRVLHQKKVKDAANLTKSEETYFTLDKMRNNYQKHFQEDEKFEDSMAIPYKTKRYIRKLQMREKCLKLNVE